MIISWDNIGQHVLRVSDNDSFHLFATIEDEQAFLNSTVKNTSLRGMPTIFVAPALLASIAMTFSSTTVL